jgi:hypothetical protein
MLNPNHHKPHNHKVNNIMRTTILTLILWLISSLILQASSFGSKAHVIAIDMSGSMKAEQQAEVMQHIQTILEDRVEKGDWVFIIPIHANTVSGGFIAVEELVSKKGGRAGRIELKRKKSDLLMQIETRLKTNIGAAKQYTDILSAFSRAQEIAEQKAVEVALYIISDMIHETATSTLTDMTTMVTQNKQQDLLQMYHLKQNMDELNLYVIQPAGIRGTTSQDAQQAIRDTWNLLFTVIPVSVKHWDTSIY